MDIEKIGNRIRYARGLQNVTLDDIAIKVSVAKSTIQRYESGKIVNPKIPVLHSIANALKVDPMWLIGKTNDMISKKGETSVIMQYYNALNDMGKHEATKRVEELTYITRYTTPDPLLPVAAHTDDTSPENSHTMGDDFNDFDDLP